MHSPQSHSQLTHWALNPSLLPPKPRGSHCCLCSLPRCVHNALSPAPHPAGPLGLKSISCHPSLGAANASSAAFHVVCTMHSAQPHTQLVHWAFSPPLLPPKPRGSYCCLCSLPHCVHNAFSPAPHPAGPLGLKPISCHPSLGAANAASAAFHIVCTIYSPQPHTQLAH